MAAAGYPLPSRAQGGVHTWHHNFIVIRRPCTTTASKQVQTLTAWPCGRNGMDNGKHGMYNKGMSTTTWSSRRDLHNTTVAQASVDAYSVTMVLKVFLRDAQMLQKIISLHIQNHMVIPEGSTYQDPSECRRLQRDHAVAMVWIMESTECTTKVCQQPHGHPGGIYTTPL